MEELEMGEREAREIQIRGVLSWLEPGGSSLPEDDLYRVSLLRLRGTCKWILQDQALISWMMDDDKDPILWMKGIPGGGKSLNTPVRFAVMVFT
jgi:hypothetical protein